MNVYGIASTIWIGGARSSHGFTTARPSSMSPDQHMMIAIAGLNCRASGTNGNGGAVTNAAEMPSSSGTWRVCSRWNWRISVARSSGQPMSPPSTSGPTGCRSYSRLGRDPEVAAATAQRPEQVGVLVLTADELLTCGRDEVDRAQVVAREPEPTGEPAEAATEGQPRDPGRRDDATWGCEPGHLRLVIEVPPGDATLGAHGLGLLVDPDPLHERQVDHDAVVARRVPRRAVPATAHRGQQLVLTCEVDGRDDVRGTGAARHDRGTLVDHRVPYAPSGVVVRVAGSDERPPERRAQ